MSRRLAAAITLGLCLTATACSNGDNKNRTTETTLTGKQPNGTTYTLTLERNSVQDYDPNLAVSDPAGKKSVTLGDAVKQCRIPFAEGARVYKFTLSATSKAAKAKIFVDLRASLHSPEHNKSLYDIVFLESDAPICVGTVRLHKSGSLPMQKSGYVIMMSGNYEDTDLRLWAQESLTTRTPDTITKAQGATVDEAKQSASMPFLP